MAQLDGLRAIAVTAVVIYHLLPGSGFGYAALSGVKLFFTLSGFLITGILLRARLAAEASGGKRFGALGRFYARRFLRIFPLYYFVIAVAFVINLEPTREILGWLLTYTLNIRMARQGWFEANFAHFWSLAVEEQFYIFWPWLVLFAPRRWLIPGAILMTLVAPLGRIWYLLSKYTLMTGLATYISTPLCLDSLGMGALLAMIGHLTPWAGVARKSLNWAVLPAVLLILAMRQLNHGDASFWGMTSLLAHDTVLTVVFCWLIAAAAPGFRRFPGTALSWGPIAYVGKISYGVYVYHPFVPLLMTSILATVGLHAPENRWAAFALGSAVTLAVASLSWFLMEKPINNLKRHFED
jgi:peptidoglycan/LPS O-acetylase OafA/YrhL